MILGIAEAVLVVAGVVAATVVFAADAAAAELAADVAAAFVAVAPAVADAAVAFVAVMEKALLKVHEDDKIDMFAREKMSAVVLVEQ